MQRHPMIQVAVGAVPDREHQDQAQDKKCAADDGCGPVDDFDP
jgi:hypothetical protein